MMELLTFLVISETKWLDSMPSTWPDVFGRATQISSTPVSEHSDHHDNSNSDSEIPLSSWLKDRGGITLHSVNELEKVMEIDGDEDRD